MYLFTRNGRTLLLAALLAVLTVCLSGCGDNGTSSGTDNKTNPGTVPVTPVLGTFTDSRDGKAYKTVKIGGQTWMAENLNYQIGNFWCYDNDNSNCDKYGMLYDWNTARIACPSGWHLPSRGEWDTLVAKVVNLNDGWNFVAGTKLKAKSGWWDNRTDYVCNGTDEYGFSALPGGARSTIGSFVGIGYIGYWWTIDEYANVNAYYRAIGCNVMDPVINGDANKERNGNSVRCVKN